MSKSKHRKNHNLKVKKRNQKKLEENNTANKRIREFMKNIQELAKKDIK